VKRSLRNQRRCGIKRPNIGNRERHRWSSPLLAVPLRREGPVLLPDLNAEGLEIARNRASPARARSRAASIIVVSGLFDHNEVKPLGL